MANVSIAEHHYTAYVGTINSGAQTTQELDLQGFTVHGLIIETGYVTGSLVFQVGHNTGTLVPLVGSDGNRVATSSITSSAFAVSSEVLKPLAAYRFVQIETSAAQTNGLRIIVPVKA
jgi:hypothetical protein